jgi:hypothetical protein
VCVHHQKEWLEDMVEREDAKIGRRLRARAQRRQAEQASITVKVINY